MSEVVWVTPDMAREWLTTSTQRWGPAPSTPAKVDKFAEAMRRGEWDPHRDVRPVELIAGRLENGHHRIHAVVKAGIPVRLPVSNTRTTGRGHQMIRLYHPKLDVHHTVGSARVAAIYRTRGWVDDEDHSIHAATFEHVPEVPMTDVGGESPEGTPDTEEE